METCDVYGGTELLLERRLFPACRPRLGRPGHELQRTVCLFGSLVNVVFLTSTLQALFLWQVLVHRRDDVHRFGGTRVPGNAEEHARVVDEVDGKSVGFNGMLAHWACHRQAQLGLFLSTWLSALTQATLCSRTGCATSSALTGGVCGLRSSGRNFSTCSALRWRC